MRKRLVIAINLIAASFLICGGARAQQSSTSSTQSTTAAKPSAPAAKPAQAPAAKPATGTTGATGTAAKKPAPTAAKSTAPALTTDKEKGSYAIGLNIGKTIKQQPIDLDLASLIRGIKDAATGATPALSEADIEAALKTMQAQAQQKHDAEMQKLGEANMKEGEAFLAANKTKDGVVTTASGLQYKILTAGTGAKPTASDTVVCNYKGTLVNGTEFDSSYKRGQPAEFPVGRVIKGWTEALQMMPVGSKWQLFIPADLAYGLRSPTPAIPPNATLIFEVELISIKDKEPAKP